jgi:ABC-2 type transport system ATP-binding protein
VRNQKIGTLSKGYRQRVGLAQAILHDPEILILDEPTSGLDPNQIIEIRELIRSLGQEKTVILSSHIMQEVQALCDRVLIINKGKIIVDDEITRLSSYMSDHTLLNVEVQGEAVDFSAFLDEHPELEVISLETNANTLSLSLKVPAGNDVRQSLARFIADKGWLVLNMSTELRSLEEIFHNLTTGEFKLPDKESVFLNEDDVEYFAELENAPEPGENEPEEEIT